MATVVFVGCTGGMGSLLFRKINDTAASTSTFLNQPIRHMICVDYFKDASAQQSLKSSCSPAIGRVDVLHWDASQLSSTESVTAQLETALGPEGSIQLVLLTTGMGFHGKLENMDSGESHKILSKLLSVNAVGPSLVLQHCARRMKRLPQLPPPSMLVLSSYSGLIGLPHRAAYCASKFALNGYLEGMAAEYQHIRYVIICPTSVATNFRDNWKKQLSSEPAGAAATAVDVNEAQLTVDQCVDGIWRALLHRPESPGVQYVILPGGKTEVAALGVRMPWGIGNMVRQRVYRQASAKL